MRTSYNFQWSKRERFFPQIFFSPEADLKTIFHSMKSHEELSVMFLKSNFNSTLSDKSQLNSQF